jgi:Lon protease-like protein
MRAGNQTYTSLEDVPEVIPVFPLTGALLLPGGQLPLNIFESRYIDMINDSLRGEKLIGMIQPRLNPDGYDENSPTPLSAVGCIGRISAFQETGDGRFHISLSGVCRFKIIEEIATNTEYRQCKIEPIETDLAENTQGDDIDRDAILVAFKNYLTANNMDADWDTVNEADTETLLTALCMMSPYDPAEKQALLEAETLKDRADTLIAISEFHLAKQNGDAYGNVQ